MEETGLEITLRDSPRQWRRFNSQNHIGGEGQNALFADGHASFKRTPLAGIDNDNIYTVMTDDWTSADAINRVHGDPPTLVDPDPFPGDDALAQDEYASTDSLIYP